MEDYPYSEVMLRVQTCCVLEVLHSPHCCYQFGGILRREGMAGVGERGMVIEVTALLRDYS